MKVKGISKTKNNKIQKFPKVAIITLNWNGWKDTIECLESVFRNSYLNYQVIVIDNGSTNGSMEKIKNWAEGKQEALTPEPKNTLYHLSHPPVTKPIPYIYYTRAEAEKGGNITLEKKMTKEWQERKKNDDKKINQTSLYPLILIQTGENLGFTGGSNIGIIYLLKKKDFDYIWFLNNDTVIEKISLIEMVRSGENSNKIGAIGSKILSYDTPNIIQALGGSDKINWKTLGKHIYSGKKDEFILNNNFEVKGYILGTSIMIKIEAIKATGTFDENYFLMAEEADLCFRIRKKGWKLFCCGESKVWHKIMNSTKSKKNVEKIFLGRKIHRGSLSRFTIIIYLLRNQLYFTRKHFSNYFKIKCSLAFLQVLRQTIGIILFDDLKLLRIKMLLKGFYDGLKGNSGKIFESNK